MGEEKRALAIVDERQVNERVVYILDRDTAFAVDLARQLGLYGYTVSIFEQGQELAAAANETPPIAVIVNIGFSDDQSGPGMMMLNGAPSIIFTAVEADFAARLKAVRAGGLAYFLRPVDTGAVVDALDRLTERYLPEPYRVLIVDDSAMLTHIYAGVLRQAGMVVATTINPTRVLDMLPDFQPDLILLDMYMPECNGYELAAVIRQQPAFHSMPIVYLSGETDRDTQLAAMHHGGDDFLTKPIQPPHLVSAVTSRIRRARVLRDQMVRDGLTGLLNHTVTKEQLTREVARSRRTGRPLAVAMLDLDRFKSINDSYGHAVGDRVLRSLARLLHQRLRASDVVGRYGGEEFAVVLPDTEVQAAIKLLNTIRERFGQVRHQAVAGEFVVTFSAGVAGMPPFNDAVTLGEAADRALYMAKQLGRNRVVLAE